MGTMREIAAIPVDPRRALVYEHGWQSWSPTAAYRLGARPHRPVSDPVRVMNYRPDRIPPPDAFWGEGLLAADPGDGGPIRVFAAPDATGPIPSIRADVRGARLIISADATQGPVTATCDNGPGGLDGALARWADGFAARSGAARPRPAPSIWCSWYHYFTQVTEADIDENVAAMDALGLPVNVVQIDDGYQAEIGDWLIPSGRFASLPDLVARIRDAGRRAGIWVAPFLAAPQSRLAREHPDWLVGGATAGFNEDWGSEVAAVDVTHPAAAEYLFSVFATLRTLGIDFFKIDFIYAGALDGRRHDPTATGLDAYRSGLRLIREAIGPDAYLLGCGAPILPSVGLVDAMRVSPDTGPNPDPDHGDMSQPAQRAATLTGRWRAWQDGRFWINDYDCLLARPAVPGRTEWAAHLQRFRGLPGSGDRLHDLDPWGLATTRELLTSR
ncbi:glycoside hydrolase family 36 protein [Streptomyces sp. NBC_01803]|uniref:glycoside hydrolase family 36 protein n=1 Tax=Streptomyces sp. NBC_01803 TaxID=2975946 RepID=UPI002DD7BAFD|nr:glycoside hydrolase family 36 protein [Streptomyces sp. NBC_01803]WSA43316.1 alpha-galactosidase [Streptomyces sp. NBC_01803]